VALRGGGQRLDEVGYWSGRPIERLTFVGRILGRLEERGWPHRADAGWSEFDVEISGPRWCSVQLKTVAEVLARDQTFLRCRLRGVWSLRSKVAFWGLLGAELLALGLWGRSSGWWWLILLSLPVLWWCLHHEKRRLQSIVAIFLDDLAAELGLVKLQREADPTASIESQTAEHPQRLKVEQRDTSSAPGGPFALPADPATQPEKRSSG
jgi:hypothetical protein